MTLRSSLRRHAVMTLLPAAALVLSFCGGDRKSGPNNDGTTKGGPVTAGAMSTAELTYGMAPSQGGAVEYQPDVVLVGGGSGQYQGSWRGRTQLVD